MTKSLGSIAAGGLFLAVVFFTLAAMVSPDRDFDFDMASDGASKPSSRQWAWDGGDRLDVRLPAKVTFLEGSEPSVTVRGPEEVLKGMRFAHGRLEGEHRSFCPFFFFCDKHGKGVEVELHGVHPSTINISGAAELALGHIDQDSLTLHVSGAGDIEGEGHVNTLDLTISGAGEARLGRLAAAKARVVLSGAGEVTIAPSEEANVSISGMGHVGLATKPKSLISSISGMGSVDAEVDTDDLKQEDGQDHTHNQDKKISDKVQRAVHKALDKAHIQND